jgi:hypothetical protein
VAVAVRVAVAVGGAGVWVGVAVGEAGVRVAVSAGDVVGEAVGGGAVAAPKA